jgi:hypothetical protein
MKKGKGMVAAPKSPKPGDAPAKPAKGVNPFAKPAKAK